MARAGLSLVVAPVSRNGHAELAATLSARMSMSKGGTVAMKSVLRSRVAARTLPATAGPAPKPRPSPQVSARIAPPRSGGRFIAVKQLSCYEAVRHGAGHARPARPRFESLWGRRIGADGGAVFDRIDALYHEPHRRYHTTAHIEHCLRQFDLAVDRMDEPDAVEMALWFHDAIYEIPAKDNELRSADLFAAQAGGRGPEEFRANVHDLIMATTHLGPPRTRDESFMLDIDLSSFGRPWEEFLDDSRSVRAELAHLSDAEFASRQKKFLASLAARPVFCFTEFFRERHEARARANIERLCAMLEAEDRI